MTTTLNKDPRYGNTPRTAVFAVTTGTGVANTDLDKTPTGTTQISFSGAGGAVPTGGIDITKLMLNLVEPALTGAASLAIFITKDGTSFYKRKSIDHAAKTLSTTVGSADDDFGFTDSAPLRLEAGDKMYVQARAASAVTEAFHGVCEYVELVAD